jgi:hypothetical protein
MGVGGNPGSTSSLDPRQEHAGVTEWTLSCISRNPQALETAVVPILIEKLPLNFLAYPKDYCYSIHNIASTDLNVITI